MRSGFCRCHAGWQRDAFSRYYFPLLWKMGGTMDLVDFHYGWMDWLSPVTQNAHVTCTRQKHPPATRVTRRHTDIKHTKRKTCALCVPDIQKTGTLTHRHWLNGWVIMCKLKLLISLSPTAGLPNFFLHKITFQIN